MKNKFLQIKNPYNNEIVGKINFKTKDEINILLNKAYSFKYNLDSKSRSEILIKAANLYEKNINKEALLITQESGICIKQALYEVRRSINALKYAALKARDLDLNDISEEYITKNDNKNIELEVIAEPYDLAVAITPFNHPLNQVIHKVAPAIAAGTSIILKPSEKTPLSAYRLREILTECGLPDNSFIVLNGLNVVNVVKQIVSYKKLDVVSFTGSVKIGKKIECIMKDSGNTLKKYIPELGGNAAFVVYKDADLDLASDIALSAFDNGGQRCTAIKRILVHKNIADKFVKLFLEKVRKIKYGNPYNKNNDIGTLIDSSAVDVIYQRVMLAIASGAKLLYGNKIDNAIYSPTVLDDVLPEMDLVKEETFGPIAPIIRFGSIEECIEIVESTRFKLAGAICTKSIEIAKRYSNQISVGQFSWNGPPGYRTENAPFGGFSDSGNGSKEGIVDSIKGLMKIRTFWRHNK